MMQMQRAKPGIGRQKHKAADMADQVIDPLPARMAAGDIVMGGFVQGGEDAVDDEGFDRHRHPVGEVAVQNQPGNRAHAGQYTRDPRHAGPGEFARQGLRYLAALLFEGAGGFQADRHVAGQLAAGGAVGGKPNQLLVEKGRSRGRIAQSFGFLPSALDDTHARGHSPLPPSD